MSFIGKISKITDDYPAFRKKQALEAVFKKFASLWSETNLPKDLKEKLYIECPLKIEAKIATTKDTTKALIDFAGDKIETVLMRHKDGRNTVCVSSQVGCVLGCSFCETGKMGFVRNLTADEIVYQVLYFARFLKKEDSRVTNIVFMGMGEPLLNYAEVMKAISIFNDKSLFDIGARRISVSTAGIIEGIKRLSSEKLQVNLAVSLHSVDNVTRSRFMPVNKTNPVDKLLQALKDYSEKTNRKIMIEYSLFAGINDSEKDALDLVDKLTSTIGRLFMVNIIKCNFNKGGLRPSKGEDGNRFKEVLKKNRVEVSERYRHGHAIWGACGQLATIKNKAF